MELQRCTVGDLIAHLAAKRSPLPPVEYRLLIAEVYAERVVAAFLRSDVPEVVGGLFQPEQGGPGTCWFSVVPGAVSRDLAPLALAMRDICRRSAPAFPEGLAAYVRDGNDDGQRLAAALGFRPTSVIVGSLRRWMLDGRRADRTDRTTPARPGAGSAAPADAAAG